MRSLDWLAFFVALPVSSANTLPAISVTPSTNWYGYDGDWSAISLRIGTPEQWVDVIPNTQSSETWVVGTGGCNDNSLCSANRGGIFNSSKSSTWSNLGFYDLSVNKELGNDGYADYGLDSLIFGSTGIKLLSSIVGTVNATDQWLGSFGLGTTPGNFNGRSPISALSALVEELGAIQSHSYGYTAGAKYQQKGVPNSLTLGGYDSNRLVAHPITFALNPSSQPQVYINSVSVASGLASNDWTTPIQLLSASDRVSAIIDSSTPYLWFPKDVCDVFAEKLRLTYNDTLNLYTFDADPTQHENLQNAQLTFSFGLSDLASSPNLVNITLPYDAFDLELTFPAIPDTTYGSDDSSKFYFPLRQATNEAEYRIGRAFLQEAYIITDYERNAFSVHQAIHTSDPISNLNITAIPRASSTTFSAPPSSSRKLSVGAIVGIVIGVLAVITIISILIFWVCRRRKMTEVIDEKMGSPIESRSMFSRFLRRGRSPHIHETNGSETFAAEVGADASHERFELPAPLGPIELDSESGTLTGRTSFETTENMSAYEIARRKLARQRQASTPPEKTETDVSQVAHYRAPDPYYDSALISPLGPDSENSMSFGQPSPMTPRFPSSQENFPPPTYRQINPANVVYVGRLPDNVQLPENVPKVVGRDGQTIRSEPSDPNVSPTEAENSTLGSQYTIDESNDLYDASTGGHQDDISPVSNESGSNGHRVGAREPRDDARLGEMLSSTGLRMDEDDLVHIPQPAEHRFSWEEERISGLDNTL